MHACKIKIFKQLQDYTATWQQMRAHILGQPAQDEIWLLEHWPVYTEGQASKSNHILQRNHIPIIRSDRGGQITYHGPGQLMIYSLVNLRQAKFGIRSMVSCLENCIIQLLDQYQINAYAKAHAPGVYVAESKIASLGLRVRHGYCYHGIALNIDMDLSPFNAINPCGYTKQAMCQIKDILPNITKKRYTNIYYQLLSNST